MNPNDPNDYRVPVLRLGDFFEDEKQKPAEYGDSSVTGFDWSTAPITTNTNATSTNTATTADIPTETTPDSEQSPKVDSVSAVTNQQVVPSHENAGMAKTATEDAHLPPQETILVTPRATPHMPKSQVIVPKQDTPLSPLTQDTVPRNNTLSPQTPLQIDTIATNGHGESTLPTIQNSPHTSVQPSSPFFTPTKRVPADPVDTAVPDEPQPIRTTVPKQSDNTGDIFPKNTPSAIPTATHIEPNLSSVNSAPGLTTHTQSKPRNEPLPTYASTVSPASITPGDKTVMLEPRTPVATPPHNLTPQAIPAKPTDDVWATLEQKVSPGLSRRPAIAPTQHVARVSPTHDTTPSDTIKHETLTEYNPISPTLDVSKKAPPQNPPTSLQSAEPAPALPHAPPSSPSHSQVDPLDIWATPATSLQEIVKKHAPSRNEQTSFVEKSHEVTITPTQTPLPQSEAPIVSTPRVPIVERAAPANDLAQLRARVSQLHTTHSTPSKQEPSSTPLNRRSELARTDVQALQRGIAMLGSMPDEESETATTQNDDTNIQSIRTIQSDIQAQVTLETPSAPMPHPELPTASAAVAPSLMRTFKQDVEQAVNQRGPSLVQMVAAQENARGTNDIHARNSVSRISPGMFVLLGTAVILILSSIGVGAWLYFSQTKNDTATAKLVIESDSVMSINITGKTRSEIMRDLAQARSTLERSKGEVVRFIPVEEKMDTVSGSKIQDQLSAEVFLARINSQAHGTLTENIERDFTLGVLVQNENIPFIIFLSRLDQLANNNMLDWEPDMEDDLSPFFMLGSTDDREDAKGAGIVPFEDATVANMRVRIRKNETGTTVLTWALSGRYIIITQNEAALAALLERVRIGSVTTQP